MRTRRRLHRQLPVVMAMVTAWPMTWRRIVCGTGCEWARTFAVIWVKGDPKSQLRVIEVTQVNPEAEEFSGWYTIHKYVAKHYDPERPLIEARLTPEYKTNSRSGIVEPRKQDMHKYQRWIDTFQAGDAELVHTGWSLESGGKVPHAVCRKVDAWLRRASHTEPRALVALSEPTDAEKRRAEKT